MLLHAFEARETNCDMYLHGPGWQNRVAVIIVAYKRLIVWILHIDSRDLLNYLMIDKQCGIHLS
jgi:hypothetical protein